MALMHNSMSETVSNYTQLNTIPALMGILFAMSAGVQFLGMQISIAIPASYSFPSTHAMLVSIGVLVIAFASSDTKDWRYYESWEQIVVGAAVVLMVGAEYIVEIDDFIAANDPITGIAAFLVSMAAWSVLAR